MGKTDEEDLSEAERRALRASKFAPLPSLRQSSQSYPRLAHPGGPLTTNKAAALSKFLERKLQQPSGLSSIDPHLLECAIKNAKDTLKASSSSGSTNSGRIVRHVNSFGDSNELQDSGFAEGSGEKDEEPKLKKRKKKKNKQKILLEKENSKSLKHKRKSKS